jgi:hypothetical protein
VPDSHTANRGERDAPEGPKPHATITDSVFANNGRGGIYMGPGNLTKSRNNTFANNPDHVVNRGGEFDDEGSRFD